MSRQAGFTLIELMVTLVVLFILAALAAPSFIEWMARVRATGNANQLVGDLSLARSESATRGATVTVCARKTDTSCDADGNWANGWLVFVDGNGNGDVDAGDTVVRAAEDLSGGLQVAASGFGNTAYIQFQPYGGLKPPTAGTFLLCADVLGENGFEVSVVATGRAKASKSASCGK